MLSFGYLATTRCNTWKCAMPSVPGWPSPETAVCVTSAAAVDLWSVGVILLCILSGRYPFFRAQDDMTALIQIMRLMGTAACKDAAKALGERGRGERGGTQPLFALLLHYFMCTCVVCIDVVYICVCIHEFLLHYC